MTAAEIRTLHEVATLAERLALDARSIARRPGLACDGRRLALAKPALLMAHQSVLWSFVPETMPSREIHCPACGRIHSGPAEPCAACAPVSV